MLAWLRYKLGDDPALEPDRELGFSSVEDELTYAETLARKLLDFSDVKAALRKMVDHRNDDLPDLTNITPPYDMQELLRSTPAEKAQAKMFAAVVKHLDAASETEQVLIDALSEEP